MKGNYNLTSGFLFLYDWNPIIDRLSGDEFKALFKALIARQKDGTPFPPLEGDLTQMFADMIEPTIKRRLEGQRAGLKGKEMASKKVPPRVPTPPSEAKQSEAKQSEAHTPSQNAEMDARFARFWGVFPNKKGKETARRVFDSLNVTDELLDKMLSAIAWQKKTDRWIRDGGRYIPFPETWLSRGQWEDEEPEIPHDTSPEALSRTENGNIDPNNFDTDSFFMAALARSYGCDPKEFGLGMETSR